MAFILGDAKETSEMKIAFVFLLFELRPSPRGFHVIVALEANQEVTMPRVELSYPIFYPFYHLAT